MVSRDTVGGVLAVWATQPIVWEERGESSAGIISTKSGNIFAMNSFLGINYSPIKNIGTTW
jgi:hypothetical protein